METIDRYKSKPSTDSGLDASPDRSGATPSAPEARERINLVELLLDPRSLQALMCCGGGLLVLGLVIWLWTLDVFDNPKVLATCVGGANLAMLFGGVSLVLKTSYRTAGRAIAMLACVVLPLNLWLYDAQELITLRDEGSLWVPALMICGLYALTARMLKDSLFVYTLVAGVSMTGLLFLADGDVNRFWEVIPASALLVSLGVGCVHAERLFPAGKGDFTRENFGRAFFNAGHFAMAAGLLVLFGGRVAGWLYEPFFEGLDLFEKPHVATRDAVKWIALGLAGLATYTYFYSQIVVGRGGRYVYSALLTLLWCEVIAVDLFVDHVTPQLLVLIVGSTALAANATALRALAVTGSKKVGGGKNEEDEPTNADDTFGLAELADFGGRVGAGMVAVATVVGAVLFLVGAMAGLQAMVFEADVMFVAAMAAVASAGWLGSKLQRKLNRSGLASFLEGSAVTTGVLGTLAMLPLLNMPYLAAALPVAGLVTLGVQLLGMRSADDQRQRVCRHFAMLAGTVLSVVALASLVGFAPASTAMFANYQSLLLAVCYAEVAVVFALGERGKDASDTPASFVPSAMAAVSASAAAWQALVFVGLATYAPLLAVSLVGLAGVLLGRLRHSNSTLDRTSTVGCVVAIAGMLGGDLLATNRMLAGEAEWLLLGLVVTQTLVTAVAGLLAPKKEMQRALLVLSGGGVALGLLLAHDLSVLRFEQRLEIGTTVAGVVMLVAGHLGWRRESTHRDGMVSFNLAVGSLLATVPMAWGLLAHRLGADAAWGWVMLHEVGVLLVGLALLGIGIMCRLRSTTVAGSAALMTYLGSLVFLIRWPDALQTTAVYMMVGGATFFGLAVLMSVYRDRLLSAPDRIRNGQGVYRVLHWR